MDDRVATLIADHGPALERVARRFSLCADDAHDAYQRALEIYLRRFGTVDPRTEGAWMKVVVRHEAMAVRRARMDSVAGEELDLDAQASDDLATVEERLASAERSARSAEVLRRLKPDEAKALMLKAEGHSYAEIGALHGWTYTKVNRAITEGRRRFMTTYAGIERGDGCETHRLDLAELARGAASAEAMVRLRPHLRHCGGCRATVRELRGGRRRVAGWIAPPAFLQSLLQPVTQLVASGGGGRVATVAAIAGVGLSGAGGAVAPDRDAAPSERHRAAAPVRAVERPEPLAVARVVTAQPVPAPPSAAGRTHAPPAPPARAARRRGAREAPAAPEFSFEAGAEARGTSAPTVPAPRATVAASGQEVIAPASRASASPPPGAEFAGEFLP